MHPETFHPYQLDRLPNKEELEVYERKCTSHMIDEEVIMFSYCLLFLSHKAARTAADNYGGKLMVGIGGHGRSAGFRGMTAMKSRFSLSPLPLSPLLYSNYNKLLVVIFPFYSFSLSFSSGQPGKGGKSFSWL